MKVPPQASTLQLPQGTWPTLLAFLCSHFPRVGAAAWSARFAAGKVLGADGQPLSAQHPYVIGARIHYFREVANEPLVPLTAEVLFRDDQLLVVDKPHFLPVIPAGRYVEHSLLRCLMRDLAVPSLAPLHRIDRLTAGVVVFSLQPAHRGVYQRLFAERQVEKSYEAIVALPEGCRLPPRYRSRLGQGNPFFRVAEMDGTPNSETLIRVLAHRGDRAWLALTPITGRKHQLRVHLAALGAPIENDPLYPQLAPTRDDEATRPLRLLARALRFTDPISGIERHFESAQRLPPLDHQ